MKEKHRGIGFVAVVFGRAGRVKMLQIAKMHRLRQNIRAAAGNHFIGRGAGGTMAGYADRRRLGQRGAGRDGLRRKSPAP